MPRLARHKLSDRLWRSSARSQLYCRVHKFTDFQHQRHVSVQSWYAQASVSCLSSLSLPRLELLTLNGPTAGCPSGSPLVQRRGFAGSSVTTVAGVTNYTNGVSFGQTADISGSQCLSFRAVAEGSVRLAAWVVTTATASSLARNPSGYTTSFPYVAGGFCNTTTFCTIALTNLNSAQNYTIFYQPDGQFGTSRYVAHSLLPSKPSSSLSILTKVHGSASRELELSLHQRILLRPASRLGL